MRKLLGILILVLLVSAVNATVIDPTKLGLGARSVALGRCAAALALDTNSTFINPALSADLPKWGASSMLVNLSDDIAYNQLGFDLPQNFGTIGLSYMGANSGGLIGTTIEAGRIKPSGFTFDYSSSVISLLYGRKYSEDLSFGATLKYYNKSFSSVDSGTGYDLDLGLLWKPNKKLRVGVAQQNTLPAPIAQMTWSKSGNTEGIPFNTKAGLSYLLLDNVLLLADLDYAQNRPLLMHGGAEWGPLWKFLYVRGGLDQYAINASNAASNFTAGLGIALAGVNFDYAYYNDSYLGSNAAHYFSFSYAPPGPAEVKAAKIAIGEIKPTAEVKVVLKTFPDVLEGSFAKNEIEYLATAGILTGYPDGTFRPQKTVTRAEMAKLLTTLKGLDMANYPYRKVFKDIKPNFWAAGYITAAMTEGWVSGYPDKSFKPNKVLNRVEAIATLVKFEGLPLPEYISRRIYADYPLRHWASNYVYSAKDAGWLDYIKDGKLKAGSGFTRAEAAYIMAQTRAGRDRISALKKPSR